MAEPGCLHDAHFEHLEVSGDTTLTGNVTVTGEVVNLKNKNLVLDLAHFVGKELATTKPFSFFTNHFVFKHENKLSHTTTGDQVATATMNSNNTFAFIECVSNRSATATVTLPACKAGSVFGLVQTTNNWDENGSNHTIKINTLDSNGTTTNGVKHTYVNNTKKAGSGSILTTNTNAGTSNKKIITIEHANNQGENGVWGGIGSFVLIECTADNVMDIHVHGNRSGDGSTNVSFTSTAT